MIGKVTFQRRTVKHGGSRIPFSGVGGPIGPHWLQTLWKNPSNSHKLSKCRPLKASMVVSRDADLFFPFFGGLILAYLFQGFELLLSGECVWLRLNHPTEQRPKLPGFWGMKILPSYIGKGSTPKSMAWYIQGSLHYQPKQCTIVRENPYICIVWCPPKWEIWWPLI